MALQTQPLKIGCHSLIRYGFIGLRKEEENGNTLNLTLLSLRETQLREDGRGLMVFKGLKGVLGKLLSEY